MKDKNEDYINDFWDVAYGGVFSSRKRELLPLKWQALGCLFYAIIMGVIVTIVVALTVKFGHPSWRHHHIHQHNKCQCHGHSEH